MSDSTLARFAFLTSPSEGRYVFNYTLYGSEETIQIELHADQMKNILATGVPLMLRQSFIRVPVKDSATLANVTEPS